VARKPGHRGERGVSRKPPRRESRIASAEPVCSCAFFCACLHTRPRVQRAPGFPCALFFQRAAIDAKLGRIAPRECGRTPSRCLTIELVCPQPRHGRGFFQMTSTVTNVLDGAGTHPGAQLDCRPCLRRQLPVDPYQRTGARAAIELSSRDERQTITDKWIGMADRVSTEKSRSARFFPRSSR
jgi:hypothetical protein